MKHREALEEACNKYVSAYRRDLDIRVCLEAAMLEYMHARFSDVDTARELQSRVKARVGRFTRPIATKVIEATIAEVTDMVRG